VAKVFFDEALLADGWASNVALDTDGAGAIEALRRDADPDGYERLAGIAVPGLPNLHSHAFQRAMAGLTERASGAGRDSFWSWREVMYHFVERLEPEDCAAIAEQLYLEMAKQGYCRVAEFHYLHHGRDGRPYADRAEMSHAVVGAARRVGLAITHLPVLYAFGGFDRAPLSPAQRRFANDAEGVLEIVQAVRRAYAEDPDVRVGLAPHSLRAVSPELLGEAVAGLHGLDDRAPVHIHVAEQVKEVEDCLAHCGRRPVEHLYDLAGPDRRWCLIHATHVTDREVEVIAKSGAVAGLCPTTEANLGDGIFPLRRFLDLDGVMGVGSDSHISVNPREELRWLEYGQRLIHQARNTVASEARPHVGARLYEACLTGGARATGAASGRLAPGRRADLVVLDPKTPAFYGKSGDTLMDALIFATNDNPVKDVMVGGRWVIRDRRHPAQSEIAERYRRTMKALLER
jgi:formimidoylglutamate deiminase